MEDNTESRKFVWIQLSIQQRAKELKNGSLAAEKITQALYTSFDSDFHLSWHFC